MVSDKLIALWKAQGRYDKLQEHGIIIEQNNPISNEQDVQVSSTEQSTMLPLKKHSHYSNNIVFRSNQKLEFMEKCRKQNLSPSQVLKELVNKYVQEN